MKLDRVSQILQNTTETSLKTDFREERDDDQQNSTKVYVQSQCSFIVVI